MVIGKGRGAGLAILTFPGWSIVRASLRTPSTRPSGHCGLKELLQSRHCQVSLEQERYGIG